MNLNKKRRRMKTGLKVLFISIPIWIVIVIGMYLANRYLIEHVEMTHVPKSLVKVASVNSITDKNKVKTASRVKLVSDDWNYIDGNMSIKITKSQVKFENRTSVMFVADVQLSDMAFFQTAFAKNEFGMNILQKTSEMANNNQAIFAINGDYYGFRDDGVIIRNSILFRNNPARDMLAIFEEGNMAVYDENSANVKALMSTGLIDTFSFGPNLVSNGVPASQFPKMTKDIDIHFQNPNPRTGIGFISPKHFLFVVVDGRSSKYSIGLTLPEFAQELASLGCKEAYNLDGGSSSTMYFKGRIVNNPLGRDSNYQRRISDILYISSPAGMR